MNVSKTEVFLIMAISYLNNFCSCSIKYRESKSRHNLKGELQIRKSYKLSKVCTKKIEEPMFLSET